MHQEQHGGGARDTEHGHQELAGGDADEIVHRGQICDQVGGHGARTEGLVLRHRYSLESMQEGATNTEDDVFRNKRELAGLPDAEYEGNQPQHEGGQ